MSRGLQISEHKTLLLLGDVTAVSAAVLISLWIWTLTAGYALSWSFVRQRAVWFLAVPLWLLALARLYDLRVALSVERTVRALLRAIAGLLVAYLLLYFYATQLQLPRLVALYILWEGCLLLRYDGVPST